MRASPVLDATNTLWTYPDMWMLKGEDSKTRKVAILNLVALMALAVILPVMAEPPEQRSRRRHQYG
jgi:hypothetical protein